MQNIPIVTKSKHKLKIVTKYMCIQVLNKINWIGRINKSRSMHEHIKDMRIHEKTLSCTKIR